MDQIKDWDIGGGDYTYVIYPVTCDTFVLQVLLKWPSDLNNFLGWYIGWEIA